MKDDVIRKFQNVENVINEKMRKNNINVKILNLDYDFGLIIIKKGNRIDRVFTIKASGQYQIRIIEDNNVLEYGVFIDDIGKWIYNLYNPVKYLYNFYGGRLSGKVLEEKEVKKIAIGQTESVEKIKKQGRTTYKEELANKPIVAEYLGPMYDGIDYGIVNLRYETQQEYDLLSH